jgi:ribosomal protein S18 acetylase RimI-like enzyme
MTTVSTRVASLADLAAVAPLFDAYRQFYEQEANLEAAEAFVRARMERGESFIIVAESGEGEVLGFCQLYPSFCSVIAAPIVVLYDLFVAPASRQSGAGRALMLAAERYAQQHGFARMDLTTAKTNVLAQSLYASLGWQRDEVFYAYNRSC